MILVKVHPKKVLNKKPRKIGFLGKPFLVSLFTKVKYTFEISIERRIFDIPTDLFEEKKFSSHRRVNVYR